jgi:hypothetical protein
MFFDNLSSKETSRVLGSVSKCLFEFGADIWPSLRAMQFIVQVTLREGSMLNKSLGIVVGRSIDQSGELL